MKKVLRISIALSLAVLTLGIGIALAAGEDATISGYDVTGCTDSDTITIYSAAVAGTTGDEYDITVENLSRPGSSGGINVGFNAAYVVPLPGGMRPGDRLRIFTGVWDYGINGYADSDTLTFRCGDAREKAEKEVSVPYTGVNLLSAEQQAMYMAVPNAAGATPCGVFDVNGWGAKYVGLGDFPGCTAPVTVMCYNDLGEWTASEVSNIVNHGDYEVDFTSSQHGICALFAQ